MRQVTGVVVDDPCVNGLPRRARLAKLRQHLRHVAHLGAERVRARRPRRVVGEQLPVFLHRRPAAGGVDDDAIDAGGSKTSMLCRASGAPARCRRRAAAARRSIPAPRASPRCSLRPPARAPWRGSRPRTTAAARSRSARPPSSRDSPTAGVCSGMRRSIDSNVTGGDSASTAATRLQKLASPDGCARRGSTSGRPFQGAVLPGLRRHQRAADRANEPAQDASGSIAMRIRCGYGTSAISSRPEQAIRQRPGVSLLDLRARLFDQRPVLHARRTGRHAGQAAEAPVEVLHEGRRHLGPALDARLHQVDRGRAASPSPRPTAGRSDTSAGRTRSGRTCRSAPTAARRARGTLESSHGFRVR